MVTDTIPSVAQRRLELLRHQLVESQAHLRQELTFLASASREWGRTARDESEREENGALSYERDASLALTDQARRRLADIEAALGRMSRGTFGVCEQCGRPIERARLEALPETPHCVQCARTLSSVTAVATEPSSVSARARSGRVPSMRRTAKTPPATRRSRVAVT